MNKLAVLLSKEKQSGEQHKPGSEAHQFHTYWDKIEKAEKQFQSAERKRQRIVDQFNNEVLPYEKQRCEARAQLIEQVLGLVGKKTLSLRYKKEALNWVSEEMNQLENSPFRGDIDLNELIDKFGQQQAKYFPPTQDDADVMRMAFSQLFGNTEDLDDDIDEMIGDKAFDPESFVESIMKKMGEKMRAEHEAREGAGAEDPDSDDPFADFFGFDSDAEHDYQQQEGVGSFDSAGGIDKKSLNKLYKRLAQKLHPDRAEDEEDRERRHALMLKLTEAKRNQDMFTVLKMVRDHGDESDAEISNLQLKGIIQQLKAKLAEIRAKKRELKDEDHLDGIIYKRFHSRTNREMEQKFKGYQQQVMHDIGDLRSQRRAITSAKQLRAVLKDRIERAFFDVEGTGFGAWMFEPN